MERREFMQVLAVAAAAGMPLAHRAALAGNATGADALYHVPAFGNVSFLHFTDCHAQLRPIYFREPSLNLGVAEATGRPPHLVGEHLLKHFGIEPKTAQAHAFTALNFTQAAQAYGKVGGFAHLATLVKRLRASRPHAWLLDGGDTWQGSATALWTKGQDMVDACKLLGVDMMSPHWEFTLGADRVQEIVKKDFGDKLAFLAHNVHTTDFEDQVFQPYVMRSMNGVPVAVIGQAFPYTPIANPRHMVPDWSFGIKDDKLQGWVDEARSKGAQAVVVLSHNGMDVDIKMASRVTGVDAILGGHTHDGVPAPVIVSNAGGKTLVTNAGSNGKFLGVLDFDVRGGKVQDFRYRLLPVFANLLPADPTMQVHIDKVRAPYATKLDEQLATSEGLLYRRGNFNGTWDQLIVDALMDVKGAQIAFSPGFRWGTSILPGQAITRDHLMDQVAITYPATTLTNMTGAMIKTVLEDVCDNLFNPDPYYQQGGDMVRVGGLQYTCDPLADSGKRISDMRLGGKAIEADKTYKVAGWAPVAQGASGTPIWEVMETYFKANPVIKPRQPNVPKLNGMAGNAGMM
jgi:sulfur-oxidizing protein SoxB